MRENYTLISSVMLDYMCKTHNFVCRGLFFLSTLSLAGSLVIWVGKLDLYRL